jgi:hypothetical protein
MSLIPLPQLDGILLIHTTHASKSSMLPTKLLIIHHLSSQTVSTLHTNPLMKMPPSEKKEILHYGEML